MSNADSDLFSPINSPADPAAGAIPDTDEQIEQLYQMLTSMSVGSELTLNFDSHNARFQIRLIGKFA